MDGRGVSLYNNGDSPFSICHLDDPFARVAELVDALDLGSSSGDRVGVQVSPLAPTLKKDAEKTAVFVA